MTQTVSSSSSITWVDSVRELDASFLEEVALVPIKMGQATVEPFLDNAVDRLFDAYHPHAWAVFVPFKGYLTSLKRLFGRKVLATFSVDIATEIMDNFQEAEGECPESEKIYEMFSCLENLNGLLEEISLRILSTLRS